MISVPAVVRNKARAVGATAWLEDLPSLIAGLERDWSIVVGRAYQDATEALVSEVTCEDGAPAVLKLCGPRAGSSWSIRTACSLEAEYDMGIVMREDPVELLDGDPQRRARWLAARTGLDATAIWEWGVVERVSTGLLGTAVGLQPVAGEMLAAADRLAG